MIINLKDFCKLVDGTMPITLIEGEWIGTFPADYIPKDYENLIVECFEPCSIKEIDPRGEGLALKCWVKENIEDKSLFDF